jgi:hypothetical protein
MKRIIFHPALPMSDKEWPFMCPTETLNSRLLESVKRALNLTEGFNVIMHEPQPRHDWVGGTGCSEVPAGDQATHSTPMPLTRTWTCLMPRGT